MDEVYFGATLGSLIVAVSLLWWRLDRNALIIKHELERSASNVSHALDGASLPDIPTLDEMREEMSDLIQDTIGSMRTPQIADHLGAVLQQWANMKMQKEMYALQNTGALENMSKVAEVVEDVLS
tara:strand:- start:1670 stop:2044 length:375 start_codon:yes stop_codon:yes gene_type:complete